MYDREYDGNVLEFETSGGLLDASLVMRDRQTDSWWSIMRGNAIGGRMEGAPLKEIPEATTKMTWGEWRKLHPSTLVLSVEGREHESRNPYADYFASDRVFRDMEITDHRLKPKQPIFSFRHDDVPYAAAYDAFERGAVFDLAGATKTSPQVFLYRDKGAELFASSFAFLVPRGLLELRDGVWWYRRSLEDDWRDATALADEGAVASLAGVEGVQRLSGFDTFWYNWVSVNENTVVLN